MTYCSTRSPGRYASPHYAAHGSQSACTTQTKKTRARRPRMEAARPITATNPGGNSARSKCSSIIRPAHLQRATVPNSKRHRRVRLPRLRRGNARAIRRRSASVLGMRMPGRQSRVPRHRTGTQLARGGSVNCTNCGSSDRVVYSIGQRLTPPVPLCAKCRAAIQIAAAHDYTLSQIANARHIQEGPQPA